ncbi:MAG: hypothetical protein HYX83_04925 [Chloroflexi bacterium]|nr:hypothetical protein [Chloroflexota bacterium]
MVRNQIHWEDVKVGDEIPSLSYDIDWRRIVAQVSGSQDFYPVHYDRDFAKSGGHAEIFINTGFTQSLFSRLLTDWVGDEGWLCKLRMEMRRMNRFGDTVVLKGKVTDKYLKDGKHYVELDVWAENAREGITTPSKATVTLPSRG